MKTSAFTGNGSHCIIRLIKLQFNPEDLCKLINQQLGFLYNYFGGNHGSDSERKMCWLQKLSEILLCRRDKV